MVSYTKYFNIEIFEGTISKHQYPWHFHDCYTIIIVEKGSLIYEFHDMSLKVNETEALLIQPYKIHRNTISLTTKYKVIFLPQEYFLYDTQNIFFTLKVNKPNIVEVLVDLLNKIKLHSSIREIKEITFKFCVLIKQLQSQIFNHTTVNQTSIPKISYDLTINELAKKAHVSKFHFQRKFKKNYGLTIGQLKQQQKTIKAKTLLENGKLSTDVAYELGFFDQSHFIKYFKKMWAITPKNSK